MAKALLKGPFSLWYFNLINSEKQLSEKFQENKYFPFQVQQPKVFVMEYYKDMIWKGVVVFLISLVPSIFYFKAKKGSQDFSVLFVYGMLIGLWLICNNMNKRRLIINHVREIYQIFIKGILWYEGPLHQIYVRLVAQRDAYGKLFYSLIINGYHLEVLTLIQLSENYEVIDSLGRNLARNLYLNYFHYEDVSGHHVIRHSPPFQNEEEEDEDEDEDDYEDEEDMDEDKGVVNAYVLNV